MNQSIRNIDAFTLGLGLKVGQDLRGRRKTKKEMRNGMQWNETVRDGCRCTMRRERERERERRTFPWRFVGGGDGGGGGLAFMVAFSFLFGSERYDTIERVCARSRE